jgi:6-phosphofructokinase
MHHPKKMAILVGGGPAPGINSVIGAATIRGALEGIEVLGVRDGFEWIMEGDIDHVTPLTIDEVSRIHFRGGSHIGISRANPTNDPQHLENAVISLLRLNVNMLLTIGGDDTAYSALKLEQKAGGRIHVVHVPKTIDNDLDLPPHVDTFGFQTARHIGVDIVKNLMVDAKTTSRWYFVIAMGRKAGHLALGIGKAAGATLTIIAEEFPGGEPIRLSRLADVLETSMLKRIAHGRPFGVAVLAEGIGLRLPPDELAQAMPEAERDEHGQTKDWVLVSTSDRFSAAQIRSTYELRPAIEERHRQYKCFWDLTRMHSCAFSLVVNQTLFVLLAYTLVQAHLVLRQRQALTHGVWERAWQLLSPTLEVVAVYYRQRFCLLTLAEFSRILLDIAEPARSQLRDKLKRIEHEQYSLLENARSP